MVAFDVGMKFGSFEEFKAQLDEYSDENKVCFWKRDLKLLGSAPVKRAATADPRLVYYSLKVCCVMGGRKFIKKKNCTSGRNTKTMRKDCPAYFFLILSKDGQYLQISSMCEAHNHPIDENVYELLPQKRRLSSLIGKAERLHRTQKRVYVSCLKSTATEMSAKSTHNLIIRQRPDSSSSDLELSSNQKKKTYGAPNKYIVEQIDRHSSTVGSKVAEDIGQMKPITQLQKFRHASALTDELAQIISESSGEEFDKKMSVVQNLIDFWKYGKEVELTEIITAEMSSEDNVVPGKLNSDDHRYRYDAGKDDDNRAVPDSSGCKDDDNSTEVIGGDAVSLPVFCDDNVQIYEEVSNVAEITLAEPSVGALRTVTSNCRIIHCPSIRIKERR